MKLNVITLIIALSLILGTQIIALLVQYKVNKEYRGIGYWLFATVLMALGFLLMPLVNIKDLELFARIANPLVILGQIFIYIGVNKFIGHKQEKWKPISIFLVFNLLYYYFMFINNNLSARTGVITITIAIISFLIAHILLFNKDKSFSKTTNFLAAIFLFYGSYNIFRLFQTYFIFSATTYLEQESILIASFLVNIFATNLWTFGLIIMVNQRLNTDNQLEKEKLQIIFNTNPDAQLITWLDEGLLVDVNDGFTVLIGYSKEEVTGKSIQQINFWNNLKDREVFTKELQEKGICKNKEFVFQRKDKSQFVGNISARIIMINSKNHIISVIRDVSERKKFENALIESEEKYRSIINASPDDITITDLEGSILMISPAAKEKFGYDPDFDDFIGMQLLDFIIPEDVERARDNLKKMYLGNKTNTNEYKGVRRDKSIFDIEVSSGLIKDASGVPNKMVFIIRDITERKESELKIQKLLDQLEIEKNTAEFTSVTDGLTGIPNRRYFDEAFKTEFFRLKRSEKYLSLIMLDIDYFKKFNDTYGHLAGDDCIKKIASKVKSVVERAPDVVARYGGEEFIVILPETDESGAKIMGEKLREVIEQMAIPHENSDVSEYVTVSLGVVTAKPKDFSVPEEILKLVDEALYAAKNSGRNRCVYNFNGKHEI